VINEQTWLKQKYDEIFQGNKALVSFFLLFSKEQFEFVFVAVAEEVTSLIKSLPQ